MKFFEICAQVRLPASAHVIILHGAEVNIGAEVHNLVSKWLVPNIDVGDQNRSKPTLAS